MISYAQQFEDIILWRALKDVQNGAYIDIGANDPVVDSVSLLFYERGWRGLHVEPMPSYAKRLRELRPDETVVEAAVGDESKDITLFQIDGTGLTTAIAEYANRHQEDGRTLEAVRVPCLHLSELFDRFNRRHVHWMKIDVEGMEESVLRSWGDHPTRPWVVVVEATIPNSPEPCFEAWEEHLFSRGYSFVYFDGLSRFYVHEDHEHLAKAFGLPPNVFDHIELSETSPFVGQVRLKLKQVEQELTARLIDLENASRSRSELEAKLEALQQSIAEAGQEISKLGSERKEALAAMQAAHSEAAELRTTHERERKHYDALIATEKSKADGIAAELEKERKQARQSAESAAAELASLLAKFEDERESLRAVLATESAKVMEMAATFEKDRQDFSAALAAQSAKTNEIVAGFEQERLSLVASLKTKSTEAEVLAELLGQAKAIEEKRAEETARQISSLIEVIEAEKRRAAESESAAELQQIAHQAVVDQLGTERSARLLAEAEREALAEQARAYGTELARQSKELDLLNSCIAVIKSEMIAQKAQNEAIRSSTSWAMTAPLRALANKSKSLVRRILEAGLWIVRSYPWMKPPLLRLARLSPRVRRKIDHFVSVRPKRPKNGSGQINFPPNSKAFIDTGGVQQMPTIPAESGKNASMNGALPLIGTPERLKKIEMRILDELSS